ncbi:Basic helix-loop-helix DNA-binding superfamily protein [Dorcoceras hygrometricum]|uniref:Basic helix-loop-helix DNA-binding superfamily protein n=1 Tax=Dorcoceras hygrometricum TaxID=472368 RepID=A0A2Z7DA36_9LAMI|nr:Basic helix-loop-helix DNA-binding superfamily protein [Dorcoceras hygrometricum]
MSDEFHLGRGNWWDSTRNRVDDTGTAPASVSARLNAIANFEWPNDMVDMKSRSSIDSGAAPGGSMVVQTQSSAASGGGVLTTPNLQMMGLGLSSSQSMDWNQAMFRGGKSESSFRSMLQEDSNTSNFLEESGTAASSHEHWRHKLYGGASSEDSSANDFKQINRGFTLDHQSQFCSQANSNDSTITSGGYQVDSAAAYGLLMSENQQQHNYENRSINYPYPPSGYGHSPGELMPSWNKFPQSLRTSPPKHPQPLPPAAGSSHLHFTNNTPFWNASATMNDARSGFFPALQNQIPIAPSFDEKPKNTMEVRDTGMTTKKNNMESSSNKRARSEMPSPLPACSKVRKEKMGDRITALQQLVSPFGKTDTASVLSEAIEYIKFLHEQVSVLSTPYMKNGAPVQRQQISDKSKDPEGPRHDLRSRGLCLVPVSSTFPVTQETTVDFWTPTFGGTFR